MLLRCSRYAERVAGMHTTPSSGGVASGKPSGKFLEHGGTRSSGPSTRGIICERLFGISGLVCYSVTSRVATLLHEFGVFGLPSSPHVSPGHAARNILGTTTHYIHEHISVRQLCSLLSGVVLILTYNYIDILLTWYLVNGYSGRVSRTHYVLYSTSE